MKNRNKLLNPDKIHFSGAWLAAILIPLAWLLLFTPYGMDTTDFGYFYGYGWRILNGQIPYRDFTYIKPAFSLYWHAGWMWLTPEKYIILGGKIGFLASILASAWFCSLFLKNQFNFSSLSLPLPLLATTGFIFGIHSFPHMPWHTADGILFSSLSLWLSGWQPFLAGIASACAMGCKQSFLPVPCIILLLIYFGSSKRQSLIFALGLGLTLASFWAFLLLTGAWPGFKSMTTGQLDIKEALDACILIYFRQNWLLPLLACVPLFIAKVAKKEIKSCFLPGTIYICLLTVAYLYKLEDEKTWIGFGLSWPTLFISLGAICLIFPKYFLLPCSRETGSNWVLPGLAMASSLVCGWCVAISGGYKSPAMFAVPGLFAFFLIHARLGGNARKLAWLTLVCGMIMFASAYQYPYTFPQRPLSRADLIYDAGQAYPVAHGVKIDKDMLERLQELKILRQKYGENYKTLPGFTLSYFLNRDYPLYESDWLIDWEINGASESFYKSLLDKNMTVFMEKDQLDAKQADAYERAGYTVPQLVRKNWKVVEETPHFVVFQRPDATPSE